LLPATAIRLPLRRLPGEWDSKSLATVHKHITNLEKKGLLDRVHNRSRSIDVVPPGTRKRNSDRLPLAGGLPPGCLSRPRRTSESISLHDVVGNRDVFALEVRGDSMRDEHIISGDYVLVERTRTARQGEIVVALVHGARKPPSSASTPKAARCACSRPTARWNRSTFQRRRWPFRDACWAFCANIAEAPRSQLYAHTPPVHATFGHKHKQRPGIAGQDSLVLQLTVATILRDQTRLTFSSITSRGTYPTI
jgi:hypothetical protein